MKSFTGNSDVSILVKKKHKHIQIQTTFTCKIIKLFKCEMRHVHVNMIRVIYVNVQFYLCRYFERQVLIHINKINLHMHTLVACAHCSYYMLLKISRLIMLYSSIRRYHANIFISLVDISTRVIQNNTKTTL